MRHATISSDDPVQHFRIERSGLRGRLVRVGPALERMLVPHDYPPAVAEMLPETVVLAAILASALKYDGIFTLQTQSDGPISLMVADVTSHGALRGYARYSRRRLAEAAASVNGAVPRLLGAGHLAFTVDQGPNTERYQGITELTGATLGDCAHTYFRQSE
jgi:molecular chaperone Hsp33